MHTSAYMERKMNDMAYHAMYRQVQQQLLPSNHPVSIKVQQVTERLMNAIPALASAMTARDGTALPLDTPSFYKVHVVDAPISNAVVLPGKCMCARTHSIYSMSPANV